jgi:hypothetical protein
MHESPHESKLFPGGSALEKFNAVKLAKGLVKRRVTKVR